MKRTCAEALALVNWKGVFYERYLLDRHVTALEGANGAGKTTVMIAAYVVLLPDMSRLRFTNLGETGATGGDKGIWGRLGERGRPSYAVLDFVLPASGRLIAGVVLERKGEPSVETTPFIVSGLAADVRLQELLLVKQGDTEVVPEPAELRENAARLGGRFQSFPSAREYFATLFELGVTPLRLGTDEERNKLNEMLRTSMTGGISRALTSELRAFLLKEEGGLADTLQRMRANLDACRRTRTEVQESRRLQEEIGGVFEAGQKMFVAAFLALRERAEELSRGVTEAEAERTAAQEARHLAHQSLESTTHALQALERQRTEVAALLESARVWHGKLRDALAAGHELAERAAQLREAEELTARVAAKRATAEEARLREREHRRRAEADYASAAAGLADLQRGIEELHRRAGAYHQVTRRLREAEHSLGTAEIAPASLNALLTSARAELDEVDRERREATTRLADAKDHRSRHARTLRALRALVGADVDIEGAHAIAQGALQQHRQRLALAERLPAIERELPEAGRLAARQSRAREQARALGIVVAEGPAAGVVTQALTALEEQRRELEDLERTARARVSEAERLLKELEARRQELAAREPQWAEHAALAARIAEAVEQPVDSRSSLDEARAALAVWLDSARRCEEQLHEATEHALREARQLLASGGPFPAELLRLRDQVGAELVAESFENVGLEDAARIEARLGSLAQALVVDDLGATVRAIARRADTLTDVLLVSREADLDALALPASSVQTGHDDLAVEEGAALRISRIPARPRLGRRAREARAAELRQQADTRALELEAARLKRRQIERLVADGEALLAGQAVWLAGNPAPQIEAIRRTLLDTEALLVRERTASAQHAERAHALGPRIGALRELLAEAMLLDPPDHAERVRSLEAEREAARAARAAVTAHARHAQIVDLELATLRQVPLSDDALARLGARVSELKARREQLDAGIDALSYVEANVEALSWEEAPRRLAAEQALLPSLDAQLQEARNHQEAAQKAADEAERRYEEATAVYQEAEGRRQAAASQHDAARQRFEGFGVPDPSEASLELAAGQVARLQNEQQSHDRHREELVVRQALQEKERADAELALQAADEKLAGARREAEPAMRRWNELRERAKQHGLLLGPLTGESGGAGGDLRQQAATLREILLERLKSAHGSETLVAELLVLRQPTDASDAYLDIWLAVRDWLRQRLPAQVAEVDDPREALERLRDQLAALEERLARQESDLRGASEDVGRGIEVQIRKARGQITRLNRNLEGVSFGSIQSIRVRLSTVERMEQVLRALREGAAQSLLFQSAMPIEEALEEIFKRFGGGRTGGQRLLDYREYVHLQVEIRRKAGTDWEIANPTRLSTGEAIGVGAALMMVVLTEWERDATVLRGKKAYGSLRFLFLDEANRLSHDNLGVLFDLCQTLDLQLLIAAPEVARAEGNTTYRLVRVTTPEGHEEVRVSGRRTRASA